MFSAQPITLNKQLSESQCNKLRYLLERGLAHTLTPYALLAEQINASESDVIEQIKQWKQQGLIKRFGMVVKHRQLGYTANAMVVWDIDDQHVDKIAGQLSKRCEVSLCYRRPRRLPSWPYNLFCMIHGKNRDAVKQQIKDITQQLNLQQVEKDILFSTKAFKQHGARYQHGES